MDDDTNIPIDAGKHYRFTITQVLTSENISEGNVTIKLDPFRIAKIYEMTSFPLQTVLKKILCAGDRGNKDYSQDIKDSICALERELEMIKEDDFLI